MKRYGIAAVMVMTLLCSAHLSWAQDPATIWQTVLTNEGYMTSFTANWSRSTEVYDTAAQQTKGTVWSSGSMMFKKSGSVSGGLLRWLTTGTNSVNSNYNMYRPTNGKTYVAYPEITTVYYRDTAIGGLAADELFGSSDLTYIGTDTINGTTVKVIDAAYPAGAAATKVRLYIWDTMGVVLKSERYNGSTLLTRYSANPSDVTTTGSYNYVVASVTRYFNPAATNEDSIHTDSFSSISINPSLADSAFDYSVPGGYTEVDQD